MTQTGSVRIDLALDRTQQEVWDVLTDSTSLSEWLAGRVSIEPQVGGNIRFELPNDNIVASGVIRSLHPPTEGMAVAMLTHTFVDAARPDVVSECNWTVVDRSPGCAVHFTHDGFGELGSDDHFATSIGRRLGADVSVSAVDSLQSITAVDAAARALGAARSVLLVSFIGPEVPTVLVELGFEVFAKTGPGDDDWASATLVDGELQWEPQSEPPPHVDLVHLDWALEFDTYLDVAVALGAKTYWFHSGRTRHPAPADSRGCWVPAPQSDEQRRRTGERGLIYIDDHYIADIARLLG